MVYRTPDGVISLLIQSSFSSHTYLHLTLQSPAFSMVQGHEAYSDGLGKKSYCLKALIFGNLHRSYVPPISNMRCLIAFFLCIVWCFSLTTLIAVEDLFNFQQLTSNDIFSGNADCIPHLPDEDDIKFAIIGADASGLGLDPDEIVSSSVDTFQISWNTEDGSMAGQLRARNGSLCQNNAAVIYHFRSPIAVGSISLSRTRMITKMAKSLAAIIFATGAL